MMRISGLKQNLGQIARELIPTGNGLRLLVFPCAEILFIFAAWKSLPYGLWLSALFVILAAVSLSYSLHIVFHEVVHRRFFHHPVTRFLSESAITVLLGTPFNEYRQSHWRHHRYTNLLEDSTSTWKATPEGPKPRGFLAYSFGWWLLGPGSMRALKEERKKKMLSDDAIRRMVVELILVVAVNVALALISLPLWAIYAATIYLGWSCIAAVNWIQHPPRDYGTGYTTSIYSPAYNTIFYNNGLHYEHHDRVQEPVIELEPTPGDWRIFKDSRRIRRPRSGQQPHTVA